MRASFLFLALLLLLGCRTNPLQPFIPASEWITVNTTPLNNKIQQAYQLGEAWIKKPEQYIFQLFALSELKSFTYEIIFDNPEAPHSMKIRLIRDGFPDDAVRGDLHNMTLRKNEQGWWKFEAISKTFCCWRTPQSDYSIQPCP